MFPFDHPSKNIKGFLMFSGGSKRDIGNKSKGNNVPFWSPWKYQKTKVFLMFSGGSKGNIRSLVNKVSQKVPQTNSIELLKQTINKDSCWKYSNISCSKKENAALSIQKVFKIFSECKEITQDESKYVYQLISFFPSELYTRMQTFTFWMIHWVL